MNVSITIRHCCEILRRLLPVLLLVPLSGFAADELEERGFFGLGWLDQTQAFTSSRADSLAVQLDRFLGVERSDLEAAYSSLRFGTELRYTEGEGIDPRVRLRGRLYLPRIDERLSLVFSEDKGEGSSYYSQNELLNQQQSTRVNLEVNLRQRDRYRFDYRIGLRSNLKLRTSVRYRYEDSLTDELQHRLSQTVYFIDDQGFGSFTQYQLDKALSEVSLLRWSTELRAQEDLDALEWDMAFNHITSYDNNTALSYFFRMSGTSDMDHVGEYQFGIRLRRSIARPWLFIDVTPAYGWIKELGAPSYEGSLFASIRLEMAIGRLQ